MIYQNIGVDVDEVLASLHAPWDRWIRDRYGIGADWSNWHIENTPGLDGRVFKFISPRIYMDGTVQPYPDAYRGLKRLRQEGATIWFTTSCIGGSEDAKLKWLDRHGLFQPGDEFKPARDKNHPGMDLLIDDRYQNCVDVDCPAILITRPWNEKRPYGWRAPDLTAAVDQIVDPDSYYYLDTGPTGGMQSNRGS